MSFTNALYYPWIEVQDERWLRTACLYWEKIHTIVPSSFEKPYNTRLSRELEDAGVLKALKVSHQMPELSELIQDVHSYLDSHEAAELFIKKSSGKSSRVHLKNVPIEVRGLSGIHLDKMSGTIVSQLIRRGYARPTGDNRIRMNEGLADFYMTLLANRLAEKRGFGLLTSSFAADRLAGSTRSGSRSWKSYSQEEVSDYLPMAVQGTAIPTRLVEGMMVDLVFGGLALAPDVPIKSLLAFRERYPDELARLRKKLGALASEVPKEKSFQAARQHAQDLVTNDVLPALNDLRGALKGSRLKIVCDGMLKVSFLSIASTSTLAIAGFAAPTAILVGAGISLTAAAILHSEEKKRLKRENAYSYLLALKQSFS